MELSKGDRVAPKEDTCPSYRCGQVGTIKEIRDAGNLELDIVVVHFKRDGRRPAGTVSYSRRDLMRQATIAELFP
jgi:hypothetical protein